MDKRMIKSCTGTNKKNPNDIKIHCDGPISQYIILLAAKLIGNEVRREKLTKDTWNVVITVK